MSSNRRDCGKGEPPSSGDQDDITVDRHGRKRAGRARCQASGAQLSRHDMVPKSRPLAKPRKPCIHTRRDGTRLGKKMSPMRRRPDRDGATSRQCRPRPPHRDSRGGRKRCRSLYALVAPEARRESSFTSVRSSSAMLPESLPKSPPDAEVRLIEAPGLGPALFPARRWPSRTIFSTSEELCNLARAISRHGWS